MIMLIFKNNNWFDLEFKSAQLTDNNTFESPSKVALLRSAVSILELSQILSSPV